MIKTLEFSIVTVNYCNAALLIEVLDRTLRALDGRVFEVVIVDNGSPDDSFTRLSTHYADCLNVKLVGSGHNGGFGFGCNSGARAASSDIYWFLNSDAWITSPAGLDEVLQHAAKPSSGIVGTSVLLDNGQPTPQGGGDMSFSYFLISSFRPGALFRRLPRTLRRVLLPLVGVLSGNIGRYANAHLSPMRDTIYISQGVGGASFFIQKAKYDSLNGFDERFFLYDEDGDLCLRCLAAGFTNFVAPRLQVLTYPSATTSKVKSDKMKRIKRDSRMYLIEKHFSGFRKTLLLIVTNFTWRLL